MKTLKLDIKNKNEKISMQTLKLDFINAKSYIIGLGRTRVDQ